MNRNKRIAVFLLCCLFLTMSGIQVAYSAPYVSISLKIRSNSDYPSTDPYDTLAHDNVIDLTGSNPNDGSRDVIFLVTITNTGDTAARVSIADDTAGGNYNIVDQSRSFEDIAISANDQEIVDYRARYVGSNTTDGTAITNTARIKWIHGYYNEIEGTDLGCHGDLTSSTTAYLHNPFVVPDITSQSLSTTTANPGETITFNYQINNPNSFNVDVTMGAQICPSGSSTWIDDWNNDKNVSLSPGTYNYSRQYQIPPNGNVSTPASSGAYDVRWVIYEQGNSANIYDTATDFQGLTIVETLSITGIDPASATKGQSVTFTLSGTEFQSGFTAKLINELGEKFDPISTEFVNSSTVKVTVFLGSGPTSTQSIKITNPNAQSASISFQAVESRIASLDNGILRVGVDLDRGGAIVEISHEGYNLVDTNDAGRLIQVSLWDDANPNWNPIQAGDLAGHSNPVTEYYSDSNSIYTKVRGINWLNTGSDPQWLDVDIEQWVTLENQKVKVRYRVTHFGTDEHVLHHQEFPSVYLRTELSDCITYLGDNPWGSAQVEDLGIALGQSKFFMPIEHWASFVKSDTFGLTVYSPYHTLLWKAERISVQSDPNYIAVVDQFGLKPGSVHETEVYFIVGNYPDSRQILYELESQNDAPKIHSIYPVTIEPSDFTLRIYGDNFDQGTVDQIFWKEDGHFVGQCPEVLSQSESEIAVIEKLTGATTGTYLVTVKNSAGKLSNFVELILSDETVHDGDVSPWPMFQHDPQHTGQSQFVGPNEGVIKWVITIPDGVTNEFWCPVIGGQPIIAKDDQIYLVCEGVLYSLKPSGQELRVVQPSPFIWGTNYRAWGNPIIAKNGTIYQLVNKGEEDILSCNTYHIEKKRLISIDPESGLKWEFNPVGSINHMSTAGDGAIYATSIKCGENAPELTLYAINRDGTEIWRLSLPSIEIVGMAIDPSGRILISGKAAEGKLIVVKPHGEIDWIYSSGYEFQNIRTSPSVGSGGTIYIGCGESYSGADNATIFAINPDGSFKWSFDTGGWHITAAPSIANDGTIIVRSKYGTRLAALNTDGSLRWQTSVSNYREGESAIGADGKIYITTKTGNLIALKADGSILWSLGLQESTGSPVIGPEGTIYVLTGYGDNKLFAVGSDSVNVFLSGYLRDATTNKPLAGVSVTVDGVYSDITDSNGHYEIPSLPCGKHKIMVDVPSGYSSYTYTIDTSENPTWDIFLTKPETVYGPDTPSGYGPDPVNTAIGNYIYNKKDLEIPGAGLAFVFERHYNSQCGEDGLLGFGWRHTYAATLTVNADSSVTIQWGDGKTETWTPDGSGGFTPQYGVFDTMIDNGDGTYTVKKRDLIRYNFDASGMLSSVVDKNGNTISMTYAGNDLVQITDTVGRNINLTHDVNGRITQIADPIGRTIQFAYDGNGDLVSSTDMSGNTTTYTYDANHQILTVVDPKGNTVVTNTYDDEKRVVTSQRDAKGGQTTYAYDEVNKKTTLTDALGYTTIHFHDELLRLIQETNDKSNSSYFTYDEPGNRTEVKDKNANKTTYTYDANSNVLTKTDALGNVTTITYDENNNPLTRTDALGNTTTYEYDANGNLIKATDPLGNLTTMTYNAYGQPLTITDARGNTTTNSYDAEGNLIEVTDALGNKTTYTYDGVGRRLTLTNALGKTTAYTYDNNNNLLTVTDPLGNVTTHTYDENNNSLTTTDPMGNTMTYAYDVKDLLTTTTDPLSNSITNAYDGLDRKTSVTDKRGNTTTFSYDAVGNLLTMTDPLGNSTTYSYDANGNQLTNTNPLGHTVTYAYDSLDRQTSATDPLDNSTTTTYDAIGRVTAKTNAKGQTTSFEYDAMGRLTKVIDDEAGTIIYTYDENGNRLTMKDSNGNTTTYAYDALNRLIQKVEPLGNTYQYAYDAVGNMTSLTDAKGNVISYTYDANNRLASTTYPDTSTVNFIYDANGNKIQMVDNLGTTSYAYDALNKMASYTDPFGKTVTYGYDANGNRISLTYPDSKVVTYTYDAVNRLTSVTDWLTYTTNYNYDKAGRLIGITNPNNTTTNYNYDAAGRLIELSNKKSDSSVISSYSYTLDAIGNHLQVVQDEPLTTVLTNKNITYTYDAENRLIDVSGTAYTYDTNGNLTGNGSDTFTYDYEDRLVQSNIGETVTKYSYDGLGNRLQKTEGGTTTGYVLDINGSLSNVLAETDTDGTVTAYYVYGLGLISKVLPEDAALYYHYDSRGSTIALTDIVQNVTDSYAYDAFGNVVNSNGSSENPFKHVGRYGVIDEGNGFSYIRARYYAPELGRFITKDPQTGNGRDGQSLNRYVYALNNPVILIDISGFSAQEGAMVQDLTSSSDETHEILFQMSEPSFATAGSTPEFIEDRGTDTLFYKVTSFLYTEDIEKLLRLFGPVTTGIPKDPYVQAFGFGVTIGFILTDTVTNRPGPTNIKWLCKQHFRIEEVR